MSASGHEHDAIGLAPAMPDALYRLANQTIHFNGRMT
jgi:hypothetical protein